MFKLQHFFALDVAGNTVAQWSVALCVFLGVFVTLEIIRRMVLKRLVLLSRKTHTRVDDVITGFLHSVTSPVYLIIALFVALQEISVPESLRIIVYVGILVIIISQAIKFSEEVLWMMLARHAIKNKASTEHPAIFRVGIRIILWSVGLMLILSNVGVDITSLVAGLGIGGLAISLALQQILSDLFSSFSIAVDKPFAIGDFIIVGEHTGTVKHIGLKTTRITALEGEQIVISNAELTTARVRNFKKMQQRRIKFDIGVTYDTSPEKLQRINEIVREAVEAQSNVRFNRSHFREFGESALLFEVVYFMLVNDYSTHMDTRQAINLHIHNAFAMEGIAMAFPTRTVFMRE